MANIELVRGVTYPTTYQHTDGNGATLPLTGCTVFMTIKNTLYDDDTADVTNVVFKNTQTTHTNPATGLTGWNVLIPATGVTPGKYYYDIVVKDSTGVELPPVVSGTCKVVGKQTNRTS
jgi:hypothetical protein